MSPELMPLLQKSRPAVGWRQRTRADALWLYGQGMLSGACPGEIFTSPTPVKSLNAPCKLMAAKVYC